jgi:hypothetical protein
MINSNDFSSITTTSNNKDSSNGTNRATSKIGARRKHYRIICFAKRY